MTATNNADLTPRQCAMVEMWERHTAAEFQTHSLDDTMATMTAEPYVNHVPVMTGGRGELQLRHFYGKYFIPGQPPDTEVIPVSRTVGEHRIVDEIIHRFTHTIDMPWILPGVPPTGRRVELAVVAVVEFRDGKIASEHIYWDQASALVQVGLLDPGKLPIAGVDVARKALDPKRPSNSLVDRVDPRT